MNQVSTLASDGSPAIAASALTDEALSKVISTLAGECWVVANKYTARVLARKSAGENWAEQGAGDFGERCGEAVAPIAKGRRLWWTTTVGQPATADLSALTPTPSNRTFVKSWLAEANRVTKTGKPGRSGVVDAGTEMHVGYLAAWRCQFPGCGADLRTDHSTGVYGNIGYFAHIVAASPDGPRGDANWIEAQTNAVENLMLLCDAHHRRIDRVEPAAFPADLLGDIRARNIAEVSGLLDALKYPDARQIFIVGNVTGQQMTVEPRAANQAMWLRRLRNARVRPEAFFLNGNQLHNPHSPAYWGSFMAACREDIPALRRLLNGRDSLDGQRQQLAVFVLHGTSVQILAGKVFGDSGGITLFQFHRSRGPERPGAQWGWDETVSPPAPDKYKVLVHKPNLSEATEACLIVSLTFRITPGRLPASCAAEDQYVLPTVEVLVAADDLKHEVIKHPQDLESFARKLDEAIILLQDQWKAKRIHLFVGAPSSACFKVGQKMQSRNHAVFVCHETTTGTGSLFVPTIEISNERATELFNNESVSLI